MDYIITSDGELYHYGVPGMKWGKRMARGHAGPGNYLTKKRQLAGDKKDLEYLNKGGHLSVGLTKKRQAAYDKRDKEVLEKRIAKNEKQQTEKKERSSRKLSEKQKIAMAVGITAVTTGLGVYGAVKVSNFIKDREKNRCVQNGIKSAKFFLDRGDGERAVSELIDHYNWSREDHKTLAKSIKYTIGNNSVGDKVLWKDVANHYKKLIKQG